MIRAIVFFELVRLRRSFYSPLFGCVALLGVAAGGGTAFGSSAINGPFDGFMMLIIFLPSIALDPDPAYPFLRSATRSRILSTGRITAAVYGVAMLLPAALLATVWTRAAGSRTELLLAGTTFVLGLSVRVPASSRHGFRLTPILRTLALSFAAPGVVALTHARADHHAHAMATIALDLLLAAICAFFTARAWRRADL